MIVKEFKIKFCQRGEIKKFIETWHYSKGINGCIADYCFALLNGNDMIGAMFFGRLAMAGQWKKYGKQESDVIELRRLCCIDDTPKNTESFFIGKCLRWLKKNTEIKTVVSYADQEYGHSGIIYKASNFKFEGFTSVGRVIIFEGKKYHDKCIRTKNKGEIKPFALKIIMALETGDAVYQPTKGKYIYTYQLR